MADPQSDRTWNETNDSSGDGGRSEQIEYIADLIRELRRMAEAQGLETLASVLGLAQVEAAQQASRHRR